MQPEVQFYSSYASNDLSQIQILIVKSQPQSIQAGRAVRLYDLSAFLSDSFSTGFGFQLV